MYGTVAKVRVKPGGLEKLNEWAPSRTGETPEQKWARAALARFLDQDKERRAGHPW